MYVLHNRPGSGGVAIEAMLMAGGVAHEVVDPGSPPDTPLPESFRAINPWRQVPVLIIPAGETLTETAAMVIHLSEAHAACREGPQLRVGSRVALIRWSVFMGVNLYEAVLRRTYPTRYWSAPEGGGPGADEMTAAVRLAASRRMQAGLAVIEAELARTGWLTGEGMSGADIFLAMLSIWHGPRDSLPRVAALTRAVVRHEAVAPVWRAHFGHRLTHDWQADAPGGVA